MTKAQLAVLQELMNDQDFRGKKLMKRIIWVNYPPPKGSGLVTAQS